MSFVTLLSCSLSQPGGKYYKTILCKNGTSCTFGDACKFAHTEDELRPKPEGGEHQMPMHGGSAPGTGKAYKTILCKNYIENKACSFGQKCQFAHGHHELRQMQGGPGGMAPMGPMGPMAAMAGAAMNK